MQTVVLAEASAWRAMARALALAGVPPGEIVWTLGTATSEPPHAQNGASTFTLPRALVDLIEAGLRSDADDRFDLLYRLVWRVHAGERKLLEQTDDPDMQRAMAMAGPVLTADYLARVMAHDAPLEAARAEAAGCRACGLWAPATQTVFGQGPAGATLMLVGEQPGDQEDMAGQPFVGPAGKMLDRALGEAGIDRTRVYVTNAVKHFKFIRRGTRRIHERPNTGEVAACRFWLDLERAQVAPALLVLLGATAAQAVLRRAVTIGRERGRRIALPDGGGAFVTVHPSYLLRLPDEAAKIREYAAFVDDLRAAAALAAG